MPRNFMAKQKKLSKYRFQLLVDVTGLCYRDACKELGYNTERLLIELSNHKITDSQFREKKDALDELYCRKICKLDIKILDDLITAHVEGSIKRAPRTLDMVQKELLERALNEDTETNDN